MFSVPSVTMNGGSRSRVTSRPLNAPAARPTTSPAASAAGAGRPFWLAVCAITIDVSTMTAPTDRSMPAVRMISVCATASVPTTATCCVTSDRLAGSRKRSLSRPNTMIARTSTTAGLTAG